MDPAYESRIKFKPLIAPYDTLVQILLEGEIGIDSSTFQIIRRSGSNENNGAVVFQPIGGSTSLIDPSTQKIFANLLPSFNSASGNKCVIAETFLDLNLIVGVINDLGYVKNEKAFYTYQAVINTNYNAWVKLSLTSEVSKDEISVKTISGLLSPYKINVIEYTNNITQMQLPEDPEVGMWVKILVKQNPNTNNNETINVISNNDNIFYNTTPFEIDTQSIIKFTYIDAECGWMIN